MIGTILILTAIILFAFLLTLHVRKIPLPQDHATVCEFVDINVPLRAAYDRWTLFDGFPLFMEDVHNVQQLDHKRLYWHARVKGQLVEWEAEIVEQIPDKCIAWASTSGTPHSVEVSFRRLSRSRTRIQFEMHFAALASGGTASLASTSRSRVQRDLRRCKEVLESGGRAVNAWS